MMNVQITNEKLFKKSIFFDLFLLLLAIAITLTAVLSGAFLQGKYTITVGSISPKRFTAPREVENTFATELLRQNVATSVQPSYKADINVNNRVIIRLDNFFESVGILRVQQTPISTPYQDQSSQENTADLQFGFQVKLTDEQLDYLVTSETSKYNDFRDQVYHITENALETGIKEDGISKALAGIKEEFRDLAWSDIAKNIGNEIVVSVLEANFFVDTEATNNEIAAKIADVEPVVFVEGQKIVDKDEKITEEIYQVLANLGYVNTGLADNVIPIVGAVLIVLILFAVIAVYIYYFQKKMLGNQKEMLLLFTLFSANIILARVLAGYMYQFVPILLFTMLISILIDSRLAIITNICNTFLCCIVFSGTIEFVLYFMITGCFAAVLTNQAKVKLNYFFMGMILILVGTFTIASIGFLYEKSLSDELLEKIIYVVLSGIFTIILCVGTLPFFEALFGIVSSVKLLELTNPNNKLLRRLTIEAPGTYHHSLIVANLGETAAYDIGANPTLTRVGGYYHDIGKLKNPQYFAENQAGNNPHDFLEPHMSAEMITSHVAYGLQMADEARLPKQIRDIIEQHHGNTLIKYFYYKASKEGPEGTVKEKDYRYQYSIPTSREAAVIMLADTVEAAVRSMIPSGKAMKEVEAFVRILIKDKLDDGQLAESMLTIKDLDTIANSFMRVFKGMYHERIAYPKSTMADIKDSTKDESLIPDNVPPVEKPSHYSSPESVEEVLDMGKSFPVAETEEYE